MDLTDISRHVVQLRSAEDRAGGKYRLSTLVQKRTVELMRGASRLVESRSNAHTQIALPEALAGKIELIVAPAGADAPPPPPPAPPA